MEKKETEEETITPEQARYFQDKDTLDSNQKLLPKRDDGTFGETAPGNLAVLNVLPENYAPWAKQRNKEIQKQKLVSLTKQKVNQWKDVYSKNPIDVDTELKDFAKQTEGLYSIQDLKKFLNQAIKSEVQKKKDNYKEKKEKEFKEGDFLFSYFGDFTNYLKIAEEFHQKQPFYYDDHRIWWLWNPTELKWQRVDDIDLMNAVDKFTQNPSTNSKIKTEIIEGLKRTGRKKKPLEAKETWIQFKDIIYDLETDEKFLASPKFFVTNPIPHSLGSRKETPNIDKILKEWVYKEKVQDESYVKTLKEILAYSMLSYMPIHRIFCLIGEGLNGKGTYLRLVEKLLGETNCCASEIEILSSNQFESNKLYKKLVCFIGEVDKGVFRKTKTIKSLTGEDTVRIEFKGKDGFDRKNYANPLIATNHLPETSDKTKGFYRRWTIIDFPNEFNEKKNVLKDIPEEEYSNFCLQAIDILRELFIRGEFTNDGSIHERENNYEKHSSNINDFIKIYCDTDLNSFIEFSDFVEKYNEYLVSEGLPKKSKIEIGRVVVLKGFEKKVRQVWAGLNQTTKLCLSGLKWRFETEELA